MTNWTACQSLRDIIITSVGRKKRSMLISSMMSLDPENSKTGQGGKLGGKKRKSLLPARGLDTIVESNWNDQKTSNEHFLGQLSVIPMND